MASGGANSFFKLIEQFRTQDEPAFCGLASVAMVLNSLAIDPRRPWKGPWRWFHEEMLDCCHPLERVRRHIKQHYARSDLGVEELASIAGFSRYHFTRLFKKHVGQAPYAYLLQFRLRRSLERISSSNDPIKQIAAEVGFNDYAYFCNVFKKYAGATPSGIRKSFVEMGKVEVVTG